jgi:hypothetical protein
MSTIAIGIIEERQFTATSQSQMHIECQRNCLCQHNRAVREQATVAGEPLLASRRRHRPGGRRATSARLDISGTATSHQAPPASACREIGGDDDYRSATLGRLQAKKPRFRRECGAGLDLLRKLATAVVGPYLTWAVVSRAVFG